MQRHFVSQRPAFFLRLHPVTLLTALVLTALAVLAPPSTVFAQTPPPVNFVSGQLFSGVGHGDRIPGAANVYTFALGDFNNDGEFDLVTTNNSNVWGLGLVLGNGASRGGQLHDHRHLCPDSSRDSEATVVITDSVGAQTVQLSGVGK